MDIRKHFFTEKVIGHRNGLSICGLQLVESTALEVSLEGEIGCGSWSMIWEVFAQKSFPARKD